MKLVDRNDLLDAIEEADLVLVGVGEEWGVSFDDMLKDAFFAEKFSMLPDDTQRNRFVPFLQREYLKEFRNDELKTAYANLFELVRNKNYYIISMNKDRYPMLMGFREDRMVYPCGGYIQMQCDDGCEDKLFATDNCDTIMDSVFGVNEFDSMKMHVCPVCGKELVFNNIEALKYIEGGYMTDWERYMKWLQGTVNKKLCLIELGVSMRFPSVIRWPFEKTTFYNQKAKFFRIHHSLSQAAENIGDRCFTSNENSVSYMANIFVS